jgi:predicted protein tyrosine phosphatase
MITKIRVCSYEKMKILASLLKPETLLISVRDPSSHNEIKHDRCLKFNFWDADPANFDNPIEEFFSEEDAERIIAFLDSSKSSPESQELYVNCEAGISRSGAIASFACDYLELDWHEFYKENSWIQPNPYISRTLNRIKWNRHWEN